MLPLLLTLGAVYALAVIIISLWGWGNKHKLEIRRAYYLSLQNLKKDKADIELQLQKQNAALADLERLAEEKTKGFPWLADAFAELQFLQAEKLANYMAEKPHAASRSAEDVHKLAKEKKLVDFKAKQLEYLVKYYESLIPGLKELDDDDVEDIYNELNPALGVTHDPVALYISNQDYHQLNETERNQRALNNYWRRRKSSWVLGRDYERYVGYLFEKKGYRVQYHGIEKGKLDLGRDLVAWNPQAHEVRIIQCKYWRDEIDWPIHVNHLYQLFGTTTHYRLNRDECEELELFDSKDEIIGEFWTSAHLDPVAKEAAEKLGIKVVEGHTLDKSYPCIKCNYSYSRNERIYHLPFDQQYDRTKIENEKLEYWASTIAEAELKGYRRAFRWHGDIE